MSNSPKYLSDSDQQELLEKLRKYLEKRYQTEIVELIQLDRGVLHAVRRKSPNWVVRVFSPLRPLELAQGDAQVLGFLEKQGFPAERCADPNPVSNPAGRPVVITEFVEGEKPEPSQEVFKRLGELLGDLNSLNSNNIREGGSLHHYAKLGGAPRKEIDAAISWLEEIKEKVPKQNEEMFNLLHTELSGADDCHDLPKALVHPDAILKNIVRTQDDKLVLVDWTGAGRGPRIVALAFSVWSSALTNRGWSPEQVDAMVFGYKSRVELSEEEIGRLGEAMSIRPLMFACFCFRNAIEHGKSVKGNEWWWPSDSLRLAIAKRATSSFKN